MGLGPGAWRDVSLGAWQALTGAPAVIVRTAQHPVAAQLAALRADVRTCDDLYDAHAAFADVYAAIAARVLDVPLPRRGWFTPSRAIRWSARSPRGGCWTRPAPAHVDRRAGQRQLRGAGLRRGRVDPMDRGPGGGRHAAGPHAPPQGGSRPLPLLAAQVYARQVASDLS
ncbi:MAG: hypothetical protein R2838_08800 [Caldilineaceae bacterium]